MRKLGQHFLKDHAALEKIAGALEIKKGDVVIEIGPGHGELTQELLDARKIIAVEKDIELAKFLARKFKFQKSKVKIIEGDALKIIPLLANELTSYKLTGNIPYYITGFLFRTISELKNKPETIVLTIQKEVAERITARPPKMNLLAASIQYWAEPKIVGLIKKSSFGPQPKVDSAIIRLAPHKKAASRQKNADYYDFIRLLFKQPRKTIMNNLRAGHKNDVAEIKGFTKELKIDPLLRPQNLKIDEIRTLAALFSRRK